MAFTACVVGGGPAGIAATLNLRRVGGLVTCFESTDKVGGIWNTVTPGPYDDQGRLSPIFPSMRCLLPKDVMAYSDHRFPFLTQQFPHYSAVQEYLQDYATRKGVHNLVRYRTRVERIQWLGNDPNADAFLRYSIRGARMGATHQGSHKPNRNVWLVRTVNVDSGDVIEWTFDCVVVATGRYHRPRFPEQEADPPTLNLYEKDGEKQQQPFLGHNARRQTMPALPGQTDYLRSGGQVIHGSQLKRFRDYAGKTVIVVGNGVGASEHVSELHRQGAFVVHSKVPLPKQSEAAKQAQTSLSQKHADKGMFAKLFHRFNPLVNKSFLPRLLSHRNERRGMSLSGTLDGKAFRGQMGTDGVWQSNVTSEALSSGLLGRYMAVPSVGPILRFVDSDDLNKKPEGKSEEEGKVAEEEDLHAVSDPIGYKDVELAVSMTDGAIAAYLPDSMKEDAGAMSQFATGGGVSGAEGWTGFNAGSLVSKSVPLLKMIRKAETRNDAVSKALLRKVRLTDGVEKDSKVVRVRDVDTVVFCTGYYQEFPFIADPEIRDHVEGASRKPKMQIEAPPTKEAKPEGEETTSSDTETDGKRLLEQQKDYLVSTAPYRPLYDNLFLGMIYKDNPTLAFMGMQAELLPPFLMFEAQAQYIANIMSRRSGLPETAAQMSQREAEYGLTNDVLADVSGLSIDSNATYFDALLEECGVSRQQYHYYEQISTQRKGWIAGTTLVSLFNKVRSYAPFKRRTYHEIISNKI